MFSVEICEKNQAISIRHEMKDKKGRRREAMTTVWRT